MGHVIFQCTGFTFLFLRVFCFVHHWQRRHACCFSGNRWVTFYMLTLARRYEPQPHVSVFLRLFLEQANACRWYQLRIAFQWRFSSYLFCSGERALLGAHPSSVFPWIHPWPATSKGVVQASHI